MWLSYSSCVIKFFSDWYRRYFSDPQAVLLAVLLVLGFAIVIVMGGMLAPALAAIVIAYLLEGPVDKLEVHTPRIVAVTVVFCVFLTIFVFVLIGLMPLVSRQLIEFGQDLPRMIKGTQDLLTRLHDDFPQIITPEAISAVTAEFSSGITKFSSSVLSISLASIPAIITVLVYTILGPLLVFFFLKDRDAILAYMTTFLPRDRDLLNKVWHEMDDQIGNYVRGKAYEILIVGGVTYVTFKFLGVAYAPLLAVLVGLSVIVPYIGAAVVTIPVAFAGYLQLGWGADLAWVMVAYAVIQALDGNLLVPLLFSGAVNLHPVAIIVAVLVFGGLWGFWGVFFAIPLATLVKALLNVWPREPHLPGIERDLPHDLETA